MCMDEMKILNQSSWFKRSSFFVISQHIPLATAAGFIGLGGKAWRSKGVAASFTFFAIPEALSTST